MKVSLLMAFANVIMFSIEITLLTIKGYQGQNSNVIELGGTLFRTSWASKKSRVRRRNKSVEYRPGIISRDSRTKNSEIMCGKERHMSNQFLTLFVLVSLLPLFILWGRRLVVGGGKNAMVLKPLLLQGIIKVTFWSENFLCCYLFMLRWSSFSDNIFLSLLLSLLPSFDFI